MSDQDYKPNEWIAVIDATEMTDTTLQNTQDRLHNQGVKTKVQRRKNGKVTLWRWGGWRA
jgi:hypothetical protein